LLELEPGISSADIEAESQRQQLQLPLKQARKHPGRQQLPVDLPRVEQIIALHGRSENKGSLKTTLRENETALIENRPTPIFCFESFP